MYDTFTAALNCGLQGGSKPEKQEQLTKNSFCRGQYVTYSPKN